MRPVIALALLAAWATPGAQAIGVSLHLALDDHHGRHAAGANAHDAPEPEARPAVHESSHRHELVAPDQGPPGVRPDPGAVVAADLDVALVSIDAEASTRSAWASSGSIPTHGRGSPPRLYYEHCALLR